MLKLLLVLAASAFLVLTMSNIMQAGFDFVRLVGGP